MGQMGTAIQGRRTIDAYERVLASIQVELPDLTGFAAGYLGEIGEDIRRLLDVALATAPAA